MAPALRGARPDSATGDERWPWPHAAGRGVLSWFEQVLEMLEKSLGSFQLLPRQELFLPSLR